MNKSKFLNELSFCLQNMNNSEKKSLLSTMTKCYLIMLKMV